MPNENGSGSVESDSQRRKIRKFLISCGCQFPEDAPDEDLDSTATDFIQNRLPHLSSEASSQVVVAICERFNNGAAKQVLEDFLVKLESLLESTADVQAALELAQGLRELSVNPAGVTDLILKKHGLVISMGLSNFSTSLIGLIKAASATSGIVMSRVLTFLAKDEFLKKAEDFDVLCKLLEIGVYPTPTVFKMATASNMEPEFLQMLRERMNGIRMYETIDSRDPIDLELYYKHLNIPIDYNEFVKMMRAVNTGEIPPAHPHFTAFRVSTRGVEAVTEDIDHEAVKKILDELAETSRVESARAFLVSLPQMSKKEMSPNRKYGMMGEVSMAVADKMDKAGIMMENLSSPFNPTNVLSEAEKVLKLDPSYRKMVWLNYARFELGQLINKSGELLKDGKLIQKERDVVLSNLTRSKELAKKCADAFMHDLDAVTDHFVQDPEGYKHIHVIHDMMMEFESGRQRSENDEKRYHRLIEAAYQTSFAHIETLSGGDIEDLLKTVSMHLFKAGVETPGAKTKLWECLRHQSLLNSSAIAEEITSGRTEVALQAVHELYQERIPDQLTKNLEQEEDLGNDFSKFLRETILAEVQEVAGRLRGAVTGVGKQLNKQGQSELLKKEFQVLCESFLKKIKEYEKQITKLLPGNEFSSASYAVKQLAGTCKFHNSKNRGIDKLLKIPDLSEFEKRLIQDFQQNITHAGELLSLPKELLDAGRKSCVDQGSHESVRDGLAEVGNSLDTQVKKRFPAYVTYTKDRKAMEAEHIMEKARRKNEIYNEYLEALEEEDLEYDPAEFNQRVRPVVQEIDQEYSAKYKSLKKAFESEMGDSLRLVNQAQRMGDRLDKLITGFSPLDELQREALGPIVAQLDKITYCELGEDEFELVPSKKRGDMVKAWISDDCSKSVEHGRQLCNRDFVNYRVYKTVEGERTWVGNVYVLDAFWGNLKGTVQPVLLFDAIQVSRSTQVNSRLFMQGVIDGFAKIAHDNNYAYIVSNHITSSAEGYLVSNRPHLREAYMRITAEQPTLPKNGARLSLSDDAAKTTFQSLNHGDGTFKVLWSHPDTEKVVELPELKELIGRAADAETTASLLKKAEEDPFAFCLNFQSRKGYERLQALQSDPAKLKLYLTLMNRYFGYRAAQAILANEADLELLGQFDQLGEDYAELALHFLYSGRRAVHFFLRDVLTATQNGDEPTKAFYKKLLHEQAILRPEQIREVRPLYDSFDKATAGSVLLDTYRNYGPSSLCGLNKLAHLIDAGTLNAGDRSIIETMTSYTFLDEDFEIERLVTSLKRYSSLMPGDTTSHLNPSYLALLLRNRTFRDLDELEGFVEAFDFGEEAQGADKHRLIVYAGRILSARRHGQLKPLGDVFKLMLSAERFERECNGSSEERPRKLFEAESIFVRLLAAPAELPDFSAVMANLQTGGRKEERVILIGHLLNRKASVSKLLLLSAAADQDLEKMYFYLANLEKAELQEADTLETLHKKFIKEKYVETGVSKLKDIDQLILTGEDFGFVKRGQEGILQTFFDLQNLAAMEKSQKGETETIKKKDLDEDVPTGYVGLAEFMEDQRSIYTLPFHD